MESRINSRGVTVVVISALFTGLSFLLVVLRFFTRFRILRIHGIEDYFLVAATLGTIGLTTLTIEQVRFGLGKHFDTLSMKDVSLNLESLWGAIMIYYTTLGFIKISVLLQYLRIFNNTKGVKRASYVLIALVVVYTIISVIIAGLNCRPISYFWDKSLHGTCVDQLAFWFCNAAFNILSDFAIIAVPLPALKSLQLDRKHKIAVFGVFLIGGLTIVVSILRLHSLYIVSVSTDPTYDNVGAATWSSLECNVGLICSCLPVLRPLISKLKLGFVTEVTELGSKMRHTNSDPATLVEQDKDLPLLPHERKASEAVATRCSELLFHPKMLEEGIRITTFYCVENESVGDLKDRVDSMISMSRSISEKEDEIVPIPPRV